MDLGTNCQFVLDIGKSFRFNFDLQSGFEFGQTKSILAPASANLTISSDDVP